MTVLLVAGVVLVLSLLALLGLRVVEDRAPARAARALVADPRGVFHEAMVDGLPEPARRYLLHAIAPGSPLCLSARIRTKGSFQPTPGGRRLAFRGDERIMPPTGFVWRARIGKGPIRISGDDLYYAAEGRSRFRLWGLVPTVRAGGADTSRSAAGRLAIESVLVPAALLPRRGVAWEPVEGDGDAARVTLDVGGEAHALTIRVEPDGALREAVVERWSDLTEDGAWAKVPFGLTSVRAERTFGGVTIPSLFHVGWYPGTPRHYDFLHVFVESAEYG